MCIMNWTVHGHKCLSFFLFFRFFKLRERERVVYKILGIKEKWPQSYLSYFSKGFHWRIFLLLRANRLYAIFNTGLENMGPSCPQIFFFVFFTRSNWLWVCLPRAPSNNWFFFSFFHRRGEGATSVLESQPIIWLLLPSPWCPVTWGY